MYAICIHCVQSFCKKKLLICQTKVSVSWAASVKLFETKAVWFELLFYKKKHEIRIEWYESICESSI